MSKTANVSTTDSDTKRVIVDIPTGLHNLLEKASVDADATKHSIMLVSLGQYVGYTGVDIGLLSRSASHKQAGEKRHAKMAETKKSASLLTTLKAKLTSGEELSMDDIKALILSS